MFCSEAGERLIEETGRMVGREPVIPETSIIEVMLLVASFKKKRFSVHSRDAGKSR